MDLPDISRGSSRSFPTGNMTSVSDMMSAMSNAAFTPVGDSSSMSLSPSSLGRPLPLGDGATSPLGAGGGLFSLNTSQNYLQQQLQRQIQLQEQDQQQQQTQAQQLQQTQTQHQNHLQQLLLSQQQGHQHQQQHHQAQSHPQMQKADLEAADGLQGLSTDTFDHTGDDDSLFELTQPAYPLLTPNRDINRLRSEQTMPIKKRKPKQEVLANARKKQAELLMLADVATTITPPTNEESKTKKSANPTNPRPVHKSSPFHSTNVIPKRKPRKAVPVFKEYVDTYRDTDVLLGRGGRSNHHPGNKLYREKVAELQPHYRMCEKSMKTKVAQSVVDYIQQEHGGRFLELDKDSKVKRWYVVENVTARTKVGQALRENNTEEARAAKRQKYG